MVINDVFPNSLIPSTFISWYFYVKKSPSHIVFSILLDSWILFLFVVIIHYYHFLSTKNVFSWGMIYTVKCIDIKCTVWLVLTNACVHVTATYPSPQKVSFGPLPSHHSHHLLAQPALIWALHYSLWCLNCPKCWQWKPHLVGSVSICCVPLTSACFLAYAVFYSF